MALSPLNSSNLEQLALKGLKVGFCDYSVILFSLCTGCYSVVFTAVVTLLLVGSSQSSCASRHSGICPASTRRGRTQEEWCGRRGGPGGKVSNSVCYTVVGRVALVPLHILVRPPNTVVCGLRFLLRFFFFFFYLFLVVSFIPSEFTECNSTKPSHVLVNECNLKMYVRNPPFSTTLQLNGNFNGLYLRNETWCR